MKTRNIGIWVIAALAASLLAAPAAPFNKGASYEK
jgi:hypothetical protein